MADAGKNTELIKYRLENARERLKAAVDLFEKMDFKDSVEKK